MTVRIAEVQLHGSITAEVVAAYLPNNYKVLSVENGVDELEGKPCRAIIGGVDNAGWTLDGYVIPRLGSGLIAAKEIELTLDRILELDPLGILNDIVSETDEA